MYIYLVAFTISTFLIYVSERPKKSVNKKITKFLLALGLLIPAILAGIRDSSIGTDVEVYAIFYYQQAINSSNFYDYLNVYSGASLSEVGYYLVTYVVAQIFDDYHWGLFFYQLLTVGFIYLGFKKLKKRFATPIWLGMLIYYLMLFNYSLNLIRQSIAIAICFYAVTYIFEDRYKRFILFLIIAILFHTSAIIGVFFIPMYMLLKYNTKRNILLSILKYSLFLVAFVIILISAQSVVERLVDYGILKSGYLNYFLGGTYAIGHSISMVEVIPQIIFIGLIIFNFRRLEKRSMQPLFFLINSGLLLVAYCTVLITTYVSRIGFFFIPLEAVGLANMQYCYTRNTRVYANGIIIILLLLYWYMTFAVYGTGETVPYVMM
jgi:hypothetical protein